jgi:integrase
MTEMETGMPCTGSGREVVGWVGRRGHNRVSVIRRRGVLWLEFNERTETGARKRQMRRCDGHTVEAATREARALAAELGSKPKPAVVRRGGVTPSGIVALGQLFQRYREHFLPTVSADERQYSRAVLGMFERLIGAATPAIAIGEAEWRRYMHVRMSSAAEPDLTLFPELKGGTLVERGRLRFAQFRDANGVMRERVVPPSLLTDVQRDPDRPVGWRWPEPVNKRAIQRDFKVLRRAFAWGTKQVRPDGSKWLPAELAFLALTPPPKPPKRKRQPMSDALYEALRAVAPEVSTDLADLLELLHETGRRIGAVLHLEFADADYRAGTLRWRCVFDKSDEEAVVAASPRALAIVRARAERCGIPLDAPLPVFARQVRPLRLPARPIQNSPRRLADWEARVEGRRRVHAQLVERARGRRLLARTALDWLDRAFTLAQLTRPEDRFAFHSLRRKFATDMREAGVPDAVTCAIGGWNDVKTFNEVYADVTPAMQRAAINRRSPGPGEEVV